MWRVLAGVKGKMEQQEEYYNCLVRMQDDGMKEFEHIIKIDVVRTPVPAATKEKLERLLLAYAKRNCKVGYCQGMNMIGAYFLEQDFSEEVVQLVLANRKPSGC